MALANILSRRNVLKGGSAALPLLALPAMAHPQMMLEVDPHPELLALWRAARAAVNAFEGDAEEHPMWMQFEALEARILHTPATSAAGLAAQLTLLVEEDAFGLDAHVQGVLARAAQSLNDRSIAMGYSHA